jgi:lipopolysaccharide export LptBFGC system permease protein LptF
MKMPVFESESSAVRVIIGILALLLGILAVFALDAFGLEDHVPPWLADLLTLIVMFALIAAVARGAPSKERQPRLAPDADNP